MTNEPSAFRFDIALSFPGEYRSRVEKIAERLSTHLTRSKVLYDRWLQAENARPNLDLYLSDLYLNKSRLLVFFFGAAYARKPWCGLEWRVGRELLHQGQERRMLLLRFDSAPIEGLLRIDGYLDIALLSDEQVAEHILQRWRSLDLSDVQVPEVYSRESVDSLLAFSRQTLVIISSVPHVDSKTLTLRGKGLPHLNLQPAKQLEFTITPGPHEFYLDYWGSSDRFHGMDVYRSYVKSNSVSQEFRAGIYEFKCSFKAPSFWERLSISKSNGVYELAQVGDRKSWPPLQKFSPPE